MDIDILGIIEHGDPTERQEEILRAFYRLGSKRAVARELNIAPDTIRKALKAVRRRAANKGWSPAEDAAGVAGEGFNAKGKSTLYGADGEVKLQWLKTDRDKESLMQAMVAAVESLADEIGPEEPIAPPRCVFNADLVNNFLVTDYHIGMNAWPEECGAAWDVKIAEDLLFNWFCTAISQAPLAETAILAQLGDFLHWDGLDAVTPMHGHILDADTRIQKVVRISMRVLRRIVRRLLETHNRVHIIMAEGNHDPASSIWLREHFYDKYRNESRVTVDTNPDPFYAYEHGDTSLFFHHGHKRDMKTIDDVFVAKFRELYGRTRHSYGHLGHKHCDEVLETNLMRVERHRTLAAPDSYATRGGWNSGRDAKVITYHKDFGEVGRQTISPDFVKAAISGKEAA